MNVKAFIQNSSYLQQWEKAHPNHTVKEWNQVGDLIQSPVFIEWAKSTPNATVDKYYEHIAQIQRYQQTPEYRLEVLRGQIYEMENQIAQIERDNKDLKDTISSKEHEIKHLEKINTITAVSLLAVIAICVFLVVKLIKNKIPLFSRKK